MRENLRRALLLLACLGTACLDDVTPQQPPLPGVQCRTSAECTDPKAALCDPVSYLCRPCRGAEDDARCAEKSAATPVCGDGGRCSACAGTGQSQLCAQRDPKRPVCAAGACEACARGPDCLSGVCQTDGSCGDISQVIFVDNKNGACDTARAHAGTQQDPMCEIQAGADKARQERKPFVRVAGSKTAYAPVTVNMTSMAELLIAGVPTGGDPVLVRGAGPALSVLGAATRVAVTAQGIDLGSSDDSSGVLCDQKGAPVMPELTLRSSRVFGTRGVGIVATRCRLTVDGVRIFENTRGGMRLSGSAYAVSNVMIYKNFGPGISIEAPMAGSAVRFSTIAFNVHFGQAAGIDCGGGAAIEHSIVAQNTGGASQFRGCTLSNVVTGGEMVPGGVPKMPEFLSSMEPLDLRLKGSAASRDCCIDKVPMAQGLPERDIDGARRPQGAGWDIGAHEQ